jgi:DnaA family protein
MSKQLPLSIALNTAASLSDFNWEGNELLRQQLIDILALKSDRILYLWGPKGSGKSHLLQACCQEFMSHPAMYLPLALLKDWGPESLESLEEQGLVCVDDLEAIAGDRLWEEALFHLYNRIKDSEHSLLILSGKHAPAAMPIHLADLKSRLSWGLVIQLNELSDDAKISTLKLHAQKRGFDLPKSVSEFLLTRCSRNMQDLHRLLDSLDKASLAAHRKITIPFVKETLNL